MKSKHKQHRSLGRSLLMWFLFFALTPMVVTGWFGYRYSMDGLTTAARQALEQEAIKSTRFIQSWFNYRLMDLNTQSEDRNNVNFLQTLKKEYRASNTKLKKFVKSYRWSELVAIYQNDLVEFSRRYDYIQDLLLIDNTGNILYTVAGESDLGRNIFDGYYATSRFAHSAKISLKSGQTLFSDLEHYAPANGHLAGFLTTPILDLQGNVIGLFAIQIRMQRINQLLFTQNVNSSFLHYIVGIDGLLRTPLQEDNVSEILARKIDTEQFKRWQDESAEYKNETSHNKFETAFEYIGPEGRQVIGVHQVVELPGTRWVLISEIDRDDALISAIRLKWITLLMFVLTGMLVTGFAIYLARRIIQPIVTLVEASKQVADGGVHQNVVVDANNEIGTLAEAFNQMVNSRQKYAADLESKTRQSQIALDDLAEQKFALDQHSIVAITDIKGNITFVNNKFTEISGYDREQLIGQNHRLLNSGHHSIEFFREMYRTIASGQVWHGEVCNKAKDGHLYWLDTTVVPFLNEMGKPKSYIAIRTDITTRVKAEKELFQAMDVAQDAVRQKSEFLANMSHEIRTPMNGVIGMTGLLLDTTLSSQQITYAETIMVSADALLTIINDILDFSKIEAGKLELEEVPFDLQSLAEDVAELMAVKCRDKSLEMLLHYKQGAPRYVIGDPGRIRQIMLNLLSNAIKFTEQGYILLSVDSEKIANQKTSFSISIQDTGIGIPDDKQGRIFNQFDQADGSTTRKYGGTGLGLPISKQLSEMMGGAINIESKPGVGSTFTSTLRLHESDNVDKLPIPVLEDYSVFKGLNTLIVDDIEMARTILKEQISVLGMNIEMAASGQEALDKLSVAVNQGKPFDIVIMDFHMPEMDGEMLAEKISQSTVINNPVQVFVTSSPRRGDGQRLKNMGFDGYLTKPTRTSEIPKILSVIWVARQQGEDIPLVTRHTIHEVKAQTKKSSSFANIHILLAEDNPINQMVATEMLETFGCKVTPAGNGLEAVQLIKQRDFDLIFMDCQMPEMDGFEATRRIRDYERSLDTDKTPIIAFTANAMQGDKEKCLSAGMDDYISKPVNKDGLDRVISQWLPHKIVTETDEEDRSAQACEDEISVPDVAQQEVILNLAVFNDLKTLFGDKFDEAFVQQNEIAAKNIARAKKAADKQDIDTLERVMHSLKSSCRQFGAMRLGELAEKIEAYAKQDKLADAIETMSSFMLVHDQTNECMRQNVASTSQAGLVWDKNDALARMGGKQQRLTLLIKMFIDDVPDRVNKLQNAIDNEQPDEASVHAHTIKGMVGNLGGKPLQQLAAELEDAGNDSDIDRLRALWPDFLQSYQQLLDILQYELNEPSTDSTSQTRADTAENTLSLNEQLKQLMIDLQQGDYVDPEFITDLKSLISTEQHEKLIQLREQVSRFDTELAITTLLEIAAGEDIVLSVMDDDSERSERQG